MSGFNEAQHARHGDGKFAAMHRGEANVDLTLPHGGSDPTGGGIDAGARRLVEELRTHYPEVRIDLDVRHGFLVLHAIQIANEDRNSGLGTRIMSELTAAADRRGWSMALTPDTAFGATSSTRLSRFYGRFGFVPNKGRTKDWSTTEAMIRRPTPAAGNRAVRA